MVICIFVHKKFHYRCKKFNILAITQQILAIHASRKTSIFSHSRNFFRNSRIHTTKKDDSRIHANRWGPLYISIYEKTLHAKCWGNSFCCIKFYERFYNFSLPRQLKSSPANSTGSWKTENIHYQIVFCHWLVWM